MQKIAEALQAELQSAAGAPDAEGNGDSSSCTAPAAAADVLRQLEEASRLTLAEVQGAIRAASRRGQLSGALEKRLAAAADRVASLGPVAYQSLGVAVPGCQAVFRQPFAGSSIFDRQVEAELAADRLAPRVKLRLADPPLDAIAKLLQRFGHGEEHLLSHLKPLLRDPSNTIFRMPLLSDLARPAPAANPRRDRLLRGLLDSLETRLLRCQLLRKLREHAKLAQRLGKDIYKLEAGLPDSHWPRAEAWEALETALEQLQDGCRLAESLALATAHGAFAEAAKERSPSRSSDFHVEGVIGATVRGHLLLQLLHRAHDERLEGDSPRLQALVRPLQAALGDPRAGASDWGKLAAVQAGAPTEPTAELLSTLLVPLEYAGKLFPRQMLLCLHLLGLEEIGAGGGGQAAAPRDGSGASTPDLQAEHSGDVSSLVFEDELDAMLASPLGGQPPPSPPPGQLPPNTLGFSDEELRRLFPEGFETLAPQAPPHLPSDPQRGDGGWQELDSQLFRSFPESPVDWRRRVASSPPGDGGTPGSPPPWRRLRRHRRRSPLPPSLSLAELPQGVRRLSVASRELGARLLLALDRLHERKRLDGQLLRVVRTWMDGDGDAATEHGRKPAYFVSDDPLLQIPLLPPDRLLALYTFVAAAFGEAFRTPEDLGVDRVVSEVKADFQQAATTALGGLSLQEPEVDPKLLVKRGVRAIDWRRGVLRLSTHALQHALHQATGCAAPPESGAHAEAGYCLPCCAAVRADASAAQCVDAAVGLAAGWLRMPAAAGSRGGHAALAACERAFSETESVLQPASGAHLKRLGASAEQVLPVLDSLLFAATAFRSLAESLGEQWLEMGRGLSLAHLVQEEAKLGSVESLAPQALQILQAGVQQCPELFKLAHAADAAILALRLMGTTERRSCLEAAMRAAGKAITGGMDGLDALEGELTFLGDHAASLEPVMKDCQRKSELVRDKDACPWAAQASVVLALLEERPGEAPEAAARRRAAVAPERVAAALDALLDGMTTLSRQAEQQVQVLEMAAVAARWQALDVISQLRQACAVNLAAPLEEAAAQLVLGRRWESGKPAVDVEAARASAEAAAASLLEEEERKKEAEQQRKQQEEGRRRAAEAKRKQAEAEERARRKQQQREEEAARRKKRREEEEAERRRGQQRREEAHRRELERLKEAEEERRLQQWLAAGAPQEEEQYSESGEDEADAGSTASTGSTGRTGRTPRQSQRSRKRGGRKRRLRKEQQAAAAAAGGAEGADRDQSDAQQAASGGGAPAVPERPVAQPQHRGNSDAPARTAISFAEPAASASLGSQARGTTFTQRKLDAQGQLQPRPGDAPPADPEQAGAAAAAAAPEPLFTAHQQLLPTAAAAAAAAAAVPQPPPTLLQHPPQLSTEAAAAAWRVSAPPVPPAPVAWPASVHLPAAAAAAEDAELERAMLGLGLGSSEAPPPPHGPPADGWADPATALRIAAQAAAHRLLPALEQPPLTTAPSDAASWAARGHNIPPDERPAGQHAEAPLAMWSTPSEQGSPPPVRTPDPTPAEAAAARAATDSLPFPPAAGATARKKAAALALPGLRNEAGDFNCFLNVVLQCLWRCADFRRQVLSWPPTVYRADPVLLNLATLFQELTRADSATSSGSLVRHQHVVIDPTPLREAINALPGQEFKLGEMSDAGELLLVLFEHMKGVAPAVAGTAVDAVFGLRVAEAVECQSCGRETQQSSYTQYFFNSFAAALRSSLAAGPDPGFGARLRRIEDEHKKSCDTDVGGCGTLHPVRQELEGEPPRVFTLQLVWESHEEEPATIGATLKALAEQIDLGQLYADLMPGTLYRLRAMVCYYGRHYSAFVHLPQLSRWVTFDDSSAGSIGSWSDVRQRCESGRVQPSVLLYEAVS